MQRTLCCKYCGKKRTFHGATTQAVMREIDKAGWYDSPSGDVCDSRECEQTDRLTNSGDPEQ